MAKISQYPVITTLTGQELVLMDSGPAGNRQTVTASTATISQAVSQSIAAGIGLFSATQIGVVPASGGGTATALRADGAWSASFTGTWVFGNINLTGGIGFFGTAATTSQPTLSGAKGGNTALANLITLLATFGLLIDSTT